MATTTDIQRIAAAMSALRPDWNPRSLATYLETKHAHRASRDLAIAAVIVATDPVTRTPKLLEQHGPWWTAAHLASGQTADPIRYERCPEIGHTSFPATNCSACRAEKLAIDVDEDGPVGEVPESAARFLPERLRSAGGSTDTRTGGSGARGPVAARIWGDSGGEGANAAAANGAQGGAV